MARDARAAGAPLQVVSAYRSYAQQAATFEYWVSVGGYQQALLTSARAGHSEHQLGTTLDVTSLGGAAPWTYADWGATPAGAWMAANAWRYGFVMSYEVGSTPVTCYSYEPWHYRYVGHATAAAVHASGMTLREAIWAAHGP
jgi:D-alanyl-D-alanine carboxypeptidase